MFIPKSAKSIFFSLIKKNPVALGELFLEVFFVQEKDERIYFGHEDNLQGHVTQVSMDDLKLKDKSILCAVLCEDWERYKESYTVFKVELDGKDVYMIQDNFIDVSLHVIWEDQDICLINTDAKKVDNWILC